MAGWQQIQRRKHWPSYLMRGILVFAYGILVWQISALNYFRNEYLFSIAGLSFLLVSLALIAWRFFGASRQKVRELTMLLEVSRLVNSTLEINELYVIVVKKIIQAINVDRGILFLYYDKEKELRSVTGCTGDTENPDFSGMVLQLNNSVLGRIFKAGKPVLVPHPTRNTEYIQRLGVDAYVAVPMKAREKIIGLLTVDNAVSKKSLENLNIELLMTLAEQLAIGLENANLYVEAREKIDELSRLNRVSSLGTMVAGIAHEIKNPLTSLDMFVQMMNEETDVRKFWQEFGDIIGTEIGRLKNIVEEFLGFARTPKIKTQTVNLSDIGQKIFNLVKTQATQENIEIALDMEEDICVKADTQKFTQVILNMVLNAMQAMPKGRPFKGYIELGAKRDPIYDKNRVNITIKDNGCGISKEAQKKLFDPFFTTKQTGTGLGLSIAQKIIKEHGGEIKLESQVNFGTTFIITLPLVKQNVLPEKKEVKAQAA